MNTIDSICLSVAVLHFFWFFAIAVILDVKEIERLVCNRFNKPQSLNISEVHQLSLRGPKVLFLFRRRMMTVLRIL
jgi:hypothetical protein